MTIRFLLWMATAAALQLPLTPLGTLANEEICDNGIDDDGDGLIDLNDPDCACQEATPISLIPNPSFEAQDCCPNDRSQLHCATGWRQASEATTDYLHTCGWAGWPHLRPPLPLPDGDAVVGFRNGRFGNINQPGWKEYTGACLLSPLKTGVTYRFQFHIGFLTTQISPPTKVALFGTTACQNLPFGIGDANFGCPTNAPGWQLLGEVEVSGFNEWKVYNIVVTPREDMAAIAIGPDCVSISASGNIYYFFDNLILADQRAFDFRISATTQPCDPAFGLQVPAYDSLQYQWYKDGIALVGETRPRLEMPDGEGNYQVRIVSREDCQVLRPYAHRIPVFYAQTNATICQDEQYFFNRRNLTESGIYWDTLKTALQCDSFVQLSLRVVGTQRDTVRAKIFTGDAYAMGRSRYSRPGAYDAALTSSIGCDSLVHLDLQFYQVFFPNAFSPNNDGHNDSFTIFGGNDLTEIVSLQVFDRWGNLVFHGKNLPPNDPNAGWRGLHNGQPVPNGLYVYTTQLLMDDGKTHPFSGSVVLLR